VITLRPEERSTPRERERGERCAEREARWERDMHQSLEEGQE